jgi:peroxiredoxin
MTTSSPTSAPVRSLPVAAGDAAPDFTLQTQDRKDWSLAEEIRKGDVVLCFFPFAFTGVCGTEMKCITREMAEWQKKGAQVVGVSCDSPFVLKAWAAAESFTHTFLSDQHRTVTKAYGLFWADMNTTNRATVIISKGPDGRGKIKWVQTREPGKAMTWEEVLAKVA